METVDETTTRAPCATGFPKPLGALGTPTRRCLARPKDQEGLAPLVGLLEAPSREVSHELNARVGLTCTDLPSKDFIQ